MATYADVVRVREFRSVLLAGTLSDLGDQLARVALAVLVYDRTRSPLLSAAVFGATYLPSLLGGPVLSSLADRRPARAVMVTCDVLRAYLVVALAVSAPPVPVALGLLLLVEVCTVPFDAARAAVLPDVLPGDRYVVASGLSSALHQASQVLGFGAAGLALSVLSVPSALALDALTFCASALVLSAGLRTRPPADVDGDESLWRAVSRGLAAVRDTPRVRLLLGIAWTGCGISVVPEALAAVYAGERGLPTSAVGLLLAASPTGTAVGSAVVTRLVPAHLRMRLLLPLLVTCAVPLLLVPLAPALPVTLALLVVSGAGTACLLLASTTIAREVPPVVRARVYGIASSGLMVAQGAAVLASGALASALGAEPVYLLAGAVGLALSALLAGAWRRAAAPAVPAQRTASAPAVLEVDRRVGAQLGQGVL